MCPDESECRFQIAIDFKTTWEIDRLVKQGSHEQELERQDKTTNPMLRPMTQAEGYSANVVRKHNCQQGAEGLGAWASRTCSVAVPVPGNSVMNSLLALTASSQAPGL